MTGSVSRLRALGASLLIATWAMGAAVLPVIHPCPASDSVAIASVDGAADHGDHGAPGAPAHGHDAQQCQCIGSCHASAVVAAPQAPTLAVGVPDIAATPTMSGADAPIPASRIVGFLPPSTAPPTA